MGFLDFIFRKKEKSKATVSVTMETTVGGKVAEEPSDYYHETDDGFYGYKAGEREKRSITISDGEMDIRKVRTGTIDTDETCGFDFENVIIFDRSNVVADTGEVIANAISAWPRGGNAERILRDVRMLVDMAVGEREDGFPWDNGKARELVDACERDIDHVDDDDFYQECSIYYHMGLSSCPLTPTGRKKKFPVEGVVLYDGKWAGKGIINATMSYFPSGSVGKARLIVNGLAISYAMSDGELRIKKKEKLSWA